MGGAMELRHLRYFLAVAEEKHFGRAAERLHIVQPALSMQIRALEEELGGPLFVRTSRRVDLTEAGHLLLAQARSTLAQVEHAKLTVQRVIRGELGSIRLGFAGNAVFSGKLMRDLRAFHKAYPDVELIVREIPPDRKSTRLNSSHLGISYAVFCLKKKKKNKNLINKKKKKKNKKKNKKKKEKK